MKFYGRFLLSYFFTLSLIVSTYGVSISPRSSNSTSAGQQTNIVLAPAQPTTPTGGSNGGEVVIVPSKPADGGTKDGSGSVVIKPQDTPTDQTSQSVTITTQQPDGTQQATSITIITHPGQPEPTESVTIYNPWADPNYNAGMTALAAAQGTFTIAPAGKAKPSSCDVVSQKTINNYKLAVASFSKLPKGWGEPYVINTLTELFGRLIDNIRSCEAIIERVSAKAAGPISIKISSAPSSDTPKTQSATDAAIDASSYDLVRQMNANALAYEKQLSDYATSYNDLYTKKFINPLHGVVFKGNEFILANIALQPAARLADADLVAAKEYHDAATNVWSDELTVSGFASAADAADTLHTAMATIALNVFQNDINAMRIEKDDVKLVKDLISETNPNIILLRAAVAAMGMARDTYVSYKDTAKQQASLYTMYDALYMNLTNVLKQLGSIRSGSQLGLQIAALDQSADALRTSGAGWLAAHWKAVGALLLADDYVAQGKAVWKGVNEKLESPFQKALKDAQDNTSTIDHLDDVFKSLGDAASKAYDAYVAAVTYYGESAFLPAETYVNGNPLTDEQMTTAVNKQKLYAAASSIIEQAAGLFVADQLPYAILRLKSSSLTVDAINEAQSYFSQAIPVIKQMDGDYARFAKQYPNDVASLVPFYDAVPQQNFANFIAQYAAHEFLSAVSGQTDPGVVVALYLAAWEYNAYLSPDVRKEIDGLLQQQKDLVASVRKNLQNALTYDAGLDPKIIGEGNGDPTMLSSWEAALSAARTTYALWATTKNDIFNGAQQLFQDCLMDYIASNALKVQPDSGLRAAILWFNYYVAFGDVAYGQSDLKPVDQMTMLLTPFFADGAEAARKILPDGTEKGYQQAIQALNDLMVWQREADWLIGAMQAVIKALNSDQMVPIELSQDQTTYTLKNILSKLPLVKVPVNINQLLAKTYADYADWALDQTVSAQQSPMTQCAIPLNYHRTAAANYTQADTYYKMVGDADTAKHMADMAQVEQQIATADLIAQSVKMIMPNAMAFKDLIIPDITVYGHYFLSPWMQQLPPVIAQSAGMNDIKIHLMAYQNDANDQSVLAAVQKDLKDLAAALYLYVYLHLYGWYDAFLKNYDLLDVISHPQETVTGTGILECVENARVYRDQLDDWAKEIKTTFTLVAGASPLLIACDMPIDSVPDPNEKQVNPTATLFYSYAIKLYEAITPIDKRQDVRDRIPPLQKAVATTYLSAAYQLELLASYLLGGTVDKSLIDLLIDASERGNFEKQRTALTDTSKIKSLDQDDQSAQDFLDAVDTVASYFTAAATLADAASTTDLKTEGLVGYLYEQKGAALAKFLVGDPTAQAYQDQLDRCKDAYVYANVAYTQGSFKDRALAAQKSFAQVYEAVGKALADREQYINASKFFSRASQIYQDIGADASADAQRTALLGLDMIFKGATASFLNWARYRWASEIHIGSDKFVTTNVSSAFTLLTTKCDKSLAYASPSLSAVCSNLKPSILDGLIYFLAVQHVCGQYKQLWYPDAPAIAAVTTTTPPQENPVVTQYIEDAYQKIGDSTINNLLGAMQWSSSVDKNFSDLLNKFLDLYIDDGGNLKKDKTLSVALDDIQAWAGKLFAELLSLYITTYYCAATNAQCVSGATTDVLSQIKIEAQNLANPAGQYFGN